MDRHPAARSDLVGNDARLRTRRAHTSGSSTSATSRTPSAPPSSSSTSPGTPTARTPTHPPASFTKPPRATSAERHAGAVADILIRLQAINFARKTEHLQWHLNPPLPISPRNSTKPKSPHRLKACADLLRDSEALANKLPADARDAYFQLVGYPVAITAAANERYFRSELARADEARGRDPEANLDASAAAQRTHHRSHRPLQQRHRRWQMAQHRDRKRRLREGLETLPTRHQSRSAEARRRQRLPARASRIPGTSPPSRCAPRRFRRARTESSPSTPETSPPRNDLPVRRRLARWFPASAAPVPPSPCCHPRRKSLRQLPRQAWTTVSTSQSSNPATLHVRLLPTHPLVSGQGLRLAVSIDGAAPLSARRDQRFRSEKHGMVRTRPLQCHRGHAQAPQPLKPGWHTLRLIAVDAGRRRGQNRPRPRRPETVLRRPGRNADSLTTS